MKAMSSLWYLWAFLSPFLLCACAVKSTVQGQSVTVTGYGQDLTNENQVGYKLEGFESYCSDPTKIASGAVFQLDRVLDPEEWATIVTSINAMQSDSICSLEVKDVGFKYRARFILSSSLVQHDIYLSSSDLQYIMINGVKYNRCKALYSSLSALVPKNFRRGLKLIDYYSHCCGAKGKQLPD